LRWTDLKRTGKLVEYVKAYNPDEIAIPRIQSYHALRPIPVAAIELNPGLKDDQNPGY
jgi:hypothetical protein